MVQCWVSISFVEKERRVLSVYDLECSRMKVSMRA
jgi:hypothetical protein